MMRAMLYEAAHITLVRSTKWSWLKAWAMQIARRRGLKKAIVALARRLAALEASLGTLAQQMEFGFLLDPQRRLLSIGYRCAEGNLDPSCYDLLASEARSAAFIAVAKGEIHQDCWFRLGRAHTACEGENVLISWTGTMFEYLMPAIWMKSHPNTSMARRSRAVRMPE